MHPVALGILSAYIVLLLVGGVIGFLKAGSKASLIASVGSAIPLALVAAGAWPGMVALVVLGLLQAVFIVRLNKTRKFMPSGMLLVLTVLVEAAMIWFIFLAPKA
jgi:uncharacterized membrane protein (UPF0136 family)